MKGRRTYTMAARADAMVATRETIVRAAMQLFFDNFYEDVTLAEIARAAGVSHQTVLNHFASKEGVAWPSPTSSRPRRQTIRVSRRARRRHRGGAHPGRRVRAFGDANARWAATAERLDVVASIARSRPSLASGVAGALLRSPAADRGRRPAGGPSTPSMRQPTSTRGSCSAVTSASAVPRPSAPSFNWSRASSTANSRETSHDHQQPLPRGARRRRRHGPRRARRRPPSRRARPRRHRAGRGLDGRPTSRPRAPRSAAGSRRPTGPTARPSTTRTGTGSARARGSCSPRCSRSSSPGHCAVRRRRRRGDRRAPARTSWSAPSSPSGRWSPPRPPASRSTS